MGAQNTGFRSVRTLDLLEENRLVLQRDLDNSKDLDYRKRLGQFATPKVLADEIMSYALSLLPENSISFLEPSIGTGSFYSSLLRNIGHKQIKNAIGYEIDKDYFDVSTKLWSQYGLNVYNEDFIQVEGNSSINLLISNPPYVRHHYIDPKVKLYLQDKVRTEFNLNISGLTGLYCYFMLLSKKWLAPNAICGFLVPSEFMDVNYGEVVKNFLLNNVRLLRIHRYDPKDELFDDALVSSCVVWFRNEVNTQDYDIEFSFGGSHNKPIISNKLSKSALLDEHKWTHLLDNMKTSSDSKEEKKLGDYFNIKRGLCTGDNDYFILSKDEINKYGLNMDNFLPVLPSPHNLKEDKIERDTENLPLIDNQLFLLNCKDTEDHIKKNDEVLWAYLQKGKETTATKYICKHRKLWYLQEQREPSPFLCSYMGRGTKDRKSPFRFILNKSNALATNSYINLYPKKELQEMIKDNPSLLNDIWNVLNDTDSSVLEKEGRVYGGGLKKIEPKELANVPCGKLTELLSIS